MKYLAAVVIGLLIVASAPAVMADHQRVPKADRTSVVPPFTPAGPTVSAAPEAGIQSHLPPGQLIFLRLLQLIAICKVVSPSQPPALVNLCNLLPDP